MDWKVVVTILTKFHELTNKSVKIHERISAPVSKLTVISRPVPVSGAEMQKGKAMGFGDLYDGDNP